MALTSAEYAITQKQAVELATHILNNTNPPATTGDKVANVIYSIAGIGGMFALLTFVGNYMITNF